MGKYLTLYKKWATGGLPGESGLCLAFEKEGYRYTEVDDNFLSHTDIVSVGCYWAADEDDYNNPHYWGKLTPLRQNIVLLMAAMNGEL